MSNGLVWVKFKSGKERELSAHIAYDKQHQSTMGFLPKEEAPDVVMPEIKKNEIKSPVAEEVDLISVADLDSPPLDADLVPEKKKRGRKPKQS